MDNQHRLIKGYKDLDADAIAKMNAVKELGEKIEELVHALRADPKIDQRWLSIGATHHQQGLMAMVRSVAKPDFF